MLLILPVIFILRHHPALLPVLVDGPEIHTEDPLVFQRVESLLVTDREGIDACPGCGIGKESGALGIILAQPVGQIAARRGKDRLSDIRVVQHDDRLRSDRHRPVSGGDQRFLQENGQIGLQILQLFRIQGNGRLFFFLGQVFRLDQDHAEPVVGQHLRQQEPLRARQGIPGKKKDERFLGQQIVPVMDLFLQGGLLQAGSRERGTDGEKLVDDFSGSLLRVLRPGGQFLHDLGDGFVVLEDEPAAQQNGENDHQSQTKQKDPEDAQSGHRDLLFRRAQHMIDLREFMRGQKSDLIAVREPASQETVVVFERTLQGIRHGLKQGLLIHEQIVGDRRLWDMLRIAAESIRMMMVARQFAVSNHG